MENEQYLYLVVHPAPTLIASQYKPEQFALHYISGSTRYYDGKVLFCEIDTQFRNPWFDIDAGLAALKPHPDGRPKATRFIKSYRVIEHIDFDSIKDFYITNPDGSSLRLEREETALQTREQGIVRVYAEINPLSMLVLSRANCIDFGNYITDGDHTKSAPKVCFTQLEFDADEFLQEFEFNSLIQPPLPGIHPSKLRDAVYELVENPEKNTKGISLDSNFNKIPYKMIRHGFMFAGEGKTLLFKMPSMQEIEKNHVRFWRGMF